MMRPATEEDTTNPDKNDHCATDTPDTKNGAETKDNEDTDTANSIATAESETSDETGDFKTADESVTGDAPQKPTRTGRRVSVSVRTLLVGTVIVSLVAVVGVMTWLYFGTRTKLDDQTRQADDSRHAEQISLDYAVNAAIMDYQDLGPWKESLVKNTTPELTEKLTKAATAMEQLLLPLKWNSSAKPLAAKVRSHDNGVYVVDAFVSVMTKTVQATDSLQSTATYSITVDSNNAWHITDVGGIASAVGGK